MTLSKGLRYLFALILLAMFGIAVFSAVTRQTLDEQIDATVEARQTQTAISVTPDLEATIDARMIITPTVAPPSDIAQDIGGFVGSIWDFFGQFGILAQLCCCLVLPGLFVLGVVVDPKRR